MITSHGKTTQGGAPQHRHWIGISLAITTAAIALIALAAVCARLDSAQPLIFSNTMANMTTACAQALLRSASNRGNETHRDAAFGAGAGSMAVHDGAPATDSSYRMHWCRAAEPAFTTPGAGPAAQPEHIDKGLAMVAAAMLLNLLVIIFSGWQHRQQTAMIEQFEAEGRLLRQKLG